MREPEVDADALRDRAHRPAAAALLEALRLSGRWRGRDRFAVLITGFGDGQLYGAIRDAWRTDPARCSRLHVVALEQAPSLEPGAAGAPPEALRAVPGSGLAGAHRLEHDDGASVLTLLRGPDPRKTLQAMRSTFDALIATQPGDIDRLAMLARRLAQGAPMVIRMPSGPQLSAALARSGFVEPAAIALAPDWTLAMHAPAWAPRQRWARPYPLGRAIAPDGPQAVIVGAGLAGTAVAAGLARRGWRVLIMDQASEIACGASGNLVGAFHPHLSLDDCALSRLSRAGVAALERELDRLGAFDDGIAARCGALQVGADDEAARALQRAADRLASPDYAVAVDAVRASALAGVELRRGGVHLARAGWVRPAALCARRVAAHAASPEGTGEGGGRITLRLGARVAGLARREDAWRLLDPSGGVLAEAPVVVLACARQAEALAVSAGAALSGLQDLVGQLTHLPEHVAPPVRRVVTGAGYVLPAVDGVVVVGAEYGALRDDAHARNVARVSALLRPGTAAARAIAAVQPSVLLGRAASRCATPDRLPLIGAAVDAAMARGTNAPRWALPRLDGLHVATGLGSRGLLWSALAAEVLVARLEDEPEPLDGGLLAAIDPARLAPAAWNAEVGQPTPAMPSG